MTKKIAVVTGGNRGIGLAAVKLLAEAGYSVLIGSRDLAAGEAEALRLSKEGLDICAAQLDISSPASVNAFADGLTRVDVLINNAGIYLEGASTFTEIDEETLIESINVNMVGTWRMCKAVAPLMIERGFGRIVNISTGWASLAGMEANAAAYRISKAGVNALTRVMADDLAPKGDIKVNSVCPGWVRTRMGGPAGQLSPEESARDVLWAAFFGSDGPTGKFFRLRQELPW